ncbi:hypothetical protein CDD82_4925 [Ophiocordyceps australis]|uniref:SGNH hydrolase-type esterase domain-containing protein n=1 Tax=Ophiocordyceps australis TaxID=1399860 RepID=A0A2C5ZSF1_9HYPO|nr:hypothetical protein CDD82_4925 [Ophiocordyceps australis]
MATSYPQVVLLGDSLLEYSTHTTEGFCFQAALQSQCIRRLDVVNRGLGGWNTSKVLKYLDDIIPKPTGSTPKMKYLIILLGINDAALPSLSKQHVPIDEYKRNLTQIITHVNVQAHSPKILLVTPPPINEMKFRENERARGLLEGSRDFKTSAAYSEKAREVARENEGVVLIDLWQALMDKATAQGAGGLDSLLPDGIHLAGEAYRVLYEEIKQHIGREWVYEGAQDSSGYMYPDYRDLFDLRALLPNGW